MTEGILTALDSRYRRRWERQNGRKLEKWWPVSGKFRPKQLEVIVGAILTQNTNWKNVEKALQNMILAGLTDAASIVKCRKGKLEKTIRPAGFFKQKTERLKAVCEFILDFDDFYQDVSREQLLKIKGIGHETADSILLFACDRPEFVADAYTKRIFSRYGLLKKEMKYDDVKVFFETNIKGNSKKYKEYHALIVEHAKETCRKKPLCGKCPLGECKRIFG